MLSQNDTEVIKWAIKLFPKDIEVVLIPITCHILCLLTAVEPFYLLFPANHVCCTEMAINTEGHSIPVLSSGHCMPFMIYDQPGTNRRSEDNKILGQCDRPVLDDSI